MNGKRYSTTAAEAFWYVLMNIFFGVAYLAKVPLRKALEEFGYIKKSTNAEKAWYILLNVAFGSGYFAKVIYSKALSQVDAVARLA